MFPLLFEWGPLRLHSWGFLVALGGMLSCGWMFSRREGMGLKREEHYWLLVNLILVCGFVGGRLLFIAEYVPWGSAGFWDSLASRGTGFSVLGAFAFVVAGLWVFSRRVSVPFLPVLDHFCVTLPFWHAVGRGGCFLAGCCQGRPTDAAWAVTFTHPRSLVPPEFLGRPLHPAQLYELAADLVLGLALYLGLWRRYERGALPPGVVSGAYIIAAAFLRFGLERFRGDTVASGVLGLSVAQLLSLGYVVFAGLILRQAWSQSHAARPD